MENNSNQYASEIYEQLRRVLGTYFNEVRESRNISLRDLEDSTNMSKALLSAFEKGDKMIRMENLINLMVTLEIPFNNIFSDDVTEKTGAYYDTKSIPQRDDEVLTKALIKMNLDKDDVADVLSYIDFIKFRRHNMQRNKSGKYIPR